MYVNPFWAGFVLGVFVSLLLIVALAMFYDNRRKK